MDKKFPGARKISDESSSLYIHSEAQHLVEVSYACKEAIFALAWS